MHNLEQKTARIDTLCREARILPVITIDREADILPMADALAAGGLTALEITLRTTHGLTAIRRLSEERPHLRIGAGTVLDPQTFAAAEKAGASFVVTPGCTDELLRFALDSEVPLLPGVASASEIMLAYRHGYRRFKLFPAEVSGGPAALKAFSGPFPDIRFCPTGGVSLNNLADTPRDVRRRHLDAAQGRGRPRRLGPGRAPQPRSPGALRRAPQTLRLPAWACPASAGFFYAVRIIRGVERLTSSALLADAPAFPQIVAEPALQVGYGHGMREVGVHLHQSPVLSFVAEADGLELAVLQARHQEVGEGRAAAGARILSLPFDTRFFQADGELFLEFAQGAFGRRLQALTAAAGKVPVAGEGNAGFFVAFVDDQVVAIEQRQLGAAEGRDVVHRGLRVAGWVNPA